MSNPNQRPDGNDFEEFATTEVPSYPRNTNSPLASDAPTTVFSPAAARGVSDFDAAAVPSSPSANPAEQPTTVQPAAHNPAGNNNAAQVPTSDQPTQSLSFHQPTQQQPPAEAATAVAAAPVFTPETTDAAVTPQQHDIIDDARRGTIDFGIFVIRFCVGLYLILDALGVFFQLGSDPGLEAFEQSLNGYAYPNVLSIAVPSLQLIAGVFLLLGLMTPVAAAIGIVAAAFTLLHAVNTSDAGLNIFNMDAKVALSALLLSALLGLQFTGPGKISFDFGRRWAKRPLYSSWIFAVLGIAGAVLLWWFGAGINPLN